MKRINKIFGLSFSLAALFGLASCSNEVSEPGNNDQVDNGSVLAFNLVKSPDVIAWSGSESLGNTFEGTRGLVKDENGKDYYVHNEEVEVNLSILEDHDYTDVVDLVSKLSIHVRKATDVTVFIPVDIKYAIESDDLYIFHEHYIKEGDEYVYKGAYGASDSEDDPLKISGDTKTLEYTVGDNKVILSIEHKTNGIEIKTSGIGEEVMKVCFARNNDGLNFEIYNYYQTETASWEDEENEFEHNQVTGTLTSADYAAIKTALNSSTIEFTSNPNYYINAFGWEMNDEADEYGENGKEHGNDWHTDNVNPNDCTVTPKNESDYNKHAGQMTHLNGTPYNDIYVLSSVTADDVHKYVVSSEETGSGDQVTGEEGQGNGQPVD